MHHVPGVRDRKRISGLYGLVFPACALTLVLQLSACSGRQISSSIQIYAFRPIKAVFSLGDETRFKFQTIDVVSDRRGRLLLLFLKHDLASGKKLGTFFRITSDGGASFGPERTLPQPLSRDAGFAGAQLLFFRGGLAAICVLTAGGGRNLFYSQSNTDGETWSEPVQINDEQESVLGVFHFVQPSQGDIYCVWPDRRRGFSLVIFSASHDGGRTWSPNQVLEYDFREGEQTAPILLTGTGNRLLAFWVDARDRQTLRDIRSSYSDDAGRHWSPSHRVNDDNEHVWQGLSTAVARGNQIFVAFEDFREPGEAGDNDWNIYFAKSEDNGRTWAKNIRLNDVQAGEDSHPFLTVDELGRLYCVWRSSRGSIFGDIYVSQSADGDSWSRAIKINEGDQMLFRRPLSPLSLANGKLLCHWIEQEPGNDEFHLTWLEPISTPTSAETPVPINAQRNSLSVTEREMLFADDFSIGKDTNWKTATGTWTFVDGTYMGVEPGVDKPFSSFARYKEPESYILRGRFKLDRVDHRMAYLYFRADPARDRYYVIGNSFRVGVCLGLRTDDRPPVIWGAFALHGRPLAEHRFPFQNDRWYQFRLVVAPERVDYYVDGSLMLSYEGRLQLPPGSIGVGGFSSAPTYFDDIAVYKFAK